MKTFEIERLADGRLYVRLWKPAFLYNVGSTVYFKRVGDEYVMLPFVPQH